MKLTEYTCIVYTNAIYVILLLKICIISILFEIVQNLSVYAGVCNERAVDFSALYLRDLCLLFHAHLQTIIQPSRGRVAAP